MRIGFFDSGVGGLTVLAEAQRQQPSHQYLYYADSDHAPYGCKPAAEVEDRVFAAAEFLAQQGVDALVIACNTATAVCIQRLRQRFAFPVIGMEPALKPALKPVLQQPSEPHAGNTADNIDNGRLPPLKDKRVMVLATSLTLQESKLSQLIRRFDQHGRVDKLAMDKLVMFAEQQAQFARTVNARKTNAEAASAAAGSDKVEVADVHNYFLQQLRHYNPNDYSAVVLGCTHFLYFKAILQDILGPSVTLVDGNQGTVNHLFRQLKQAGKSAHEEPGIRFFRSGVEQPSAYYEPLLALDLFPRD